MPELTTRQVIALLAAIEAARIERELLEAALAATAALREFDQGNEDPDDDGTMSFYRHGPDAMEAHRRWCRMGRLREERDDG